jgi:hypothetical protein
MWNRAIYPPPAGCPPGPAPPLPAAPAGGRAPPPASPSTTLYIRNLPYDLPPDEFRSIYAEFGEIQAVVTNQLFDRGLAFVTYFDLRSAARAVGQMQHFQTRGRSPVTGYAYQVPAASGLGPADLALTVLLATSAENLPVVPDSVTAAMGHFGEVSRVTKVANGCWLVDFFDSRAVKRAVAQSVTIAGVVYPVQIVSHREAPVPQRKTRPAAYAKPPACARPAPQYTPECLQSLLKLQEALFRNPKGA